MFYAPKTTASMVAGAPLSDLYSDLHKDAFGCRPGRAQSNRAAAMTPVEAAVEQARLQEWSAETDRIQTLRHEVARFDFARQMEYFQRRDGLSEREAFCQVVESGDRYFWKGSKEGRDWDYVCYCLHLPESDAAVLKAFWES